jgi:hypothetical protein
VPGHHGHCCSLTYCVKPTSATSCPVGQLQLIHVMPAYHAGAENIDRLPTALLAPIKRPARPPWLDTYVKLERQSSLSLLLELTFSHCWFWCSRKRTRGSHARSAAGAEHRLRLTTKLKPLSRRSRVPSIRCVLLLSTLLEAECAN